jgi:hypothetical protein
MIFKNSIAQDGKISTRTVGDRAKPERPQIRDELLQQADICIYCPKPDCGGTCKRFREMAKNGKAKK